MLQKSKKETDFDRILKTPDLEIILFTDVSFISILNSYVAEAELF